MAENKNAKFDLHVHTLGSLDGAFSIEEIIEFAKQNGVKYLALTDHNTYSEVRKFYKKRGANLSNPIIEVDGVKIIAGVEVTCRVSQITNLRSNSSKLHVLIYGADMSPESPMSQLMALKRKNDLDSDIGLLRDLLHTNGIHDISEEDIRSFIRERRQTVSGFSDLGKKDIWDFLQEHKITIATSYKELCEIMSHLPRYERLNIEFDDLMKCARASGGEIVVAHPGHNFERLSNVNRKLLAGYLSTQIDGYEKWYHNASSSTEKTLQNAIYSNKRQKDVYVTGGTDFHDASHGEIMGRVHGKDITEKDCNKFLENMEKLQVAREQGKMTHRKKINIPSREEINGILQEYNLKYRQLVANAQPDVSYGDWQRKSSKSGKKKGKKMLTATDRANLREKKLFNSGNMPTDYYLDENSNYEDGKGQDGM